MIINQIDYTSRDYAALRQDLINVVKNRVPEWDSSDPSDFTVALVEAFAYMGDIMSYYLDRAANESHIQTASQRESLLKFAEVIGYKPSGPTPSVGVVTLTNKRTVVNPGELTELSLPVGSQISVETLAGTVYFETTESVILPLNTPTNVPVIEGRTSNTDYGNLCFGLPVGLGTSDGTAYMSFIIPDKGIIDSSIEVYTGEGDSYVRWAYTNVLPEYGRFDRVYTTRMMSDGRVSVLFGDGINGAIPAVNEKVSAVYRTSSGFAGNVKTGSSATITYIPNMTSGQLTTYPITVYIPQDMVGGTDGENIALIRQNLKKAMGTRNRAVTLQDYASLAATVQGVGRSSATSDVYSQVTVYIQPYNDGSTTPGVAEDTGIETPIWSDLADTVKTFLTDRSPVNTTITVLPPTYVKLDVVLTVEALPGFRQSDVKTAVTRQLLDIGYGVFSYNGYAFNATVSLSDVIAAARLALGVKSVEVNVLDRMTDPVGGVHGTGVDNQAMTADEIPILPPENLVIYMTGGVV